MKAKTKIKVKRTVASGLIALAISSALTGIASGFIVSGLGAEVKGVNVEFSEKNGGVKTCLDIFKQSNYYKEAIITEQSQMSEKFENGEISREEYAVALSNILTDEHAGELLLNSNEDVLKARYIVLTNECNSKKQELDELNDKQNNISVVAVGGLLGFLGTGVGAVAVWPNRKDEELALQEKENEK